MRTRIVCFLLKRSLSFETERKTLHAVKELGTVLAHLPILVPEGAFLDNGLLARSEEQKRGRRRKEAKFQ